MAKASNHCWCARSAGDFKDKPSIATYAIAIALAFVRPIAGAMALSGGGADVAGAGSAHRAWLRDDG
ncbi:MAG: hypothetical protein ACYC97_07930 [Metallibacterium sp.]